MSSFIRVERRACKCLPAIWLRFGRSPPRQLAMVVTAMGTSRTAASHAACLRQESWGRRWTSQKWTTGSDCWDVLASASDLISAALSRPLLCSHRRARGQSDVWRQSPTVQARRGPLSNPAKPVSPHFLTPPISSRAPAVVREQHLWGGDPSPSSVGWKLD